MHVCFGLFCSQFCFVLYFSSFFVCVCVHYIRKKSTCEREIHHINGYDIYFHIHTLFSHFALVHVHFPSFPFQSFACDPDFRVHCVLTRQHLHTNEIGYCFPIAHILSLRNFHFIYRSVPLRYPPENSMHKYTKSFVNFSLPLCL